MKVLHVIPSVAMRYGGPSVAIRGMGEALAAAGAEVTVATTDADGPGRLDVPLDREVSESGVSYRYFAREAPGEWKFSWSLRRWVHEHAREFDAVHMHSLFCYPTAVGCSAARAAGVPYVVRPLGTLDPWSLRQSAWKKWPYLTFVERPNLAGAGAIHVTSESEAEAVRLFGYGDLTRVIELGVELVLAEAPRRDDEGALKLVFLSRLHPKKGLPLLLNALGRAVALGGNVRLDIIGDGPTSYKEELAGIAARVGVADRVRFLGQIEGADKTAALKSADVFVLPSSQENFGIAVAEAMLAGLPVLVSDQVAIARDAQRAGAGRSLPLDTDAWAGAILAVASHREVARAMGERAQRMASERYSWSRTADLLMELYGDLQGPAQARARVLAGRSA